ncbi:MAG: hypothetical protein ACK4UO_09445 [Pseudolabrys sp.]
MMKRSAMATVLAASLALVTGSALLAQESMRSIDDTARINDGVSHQPPSAAADIPVPTPEETLAAKLTPVPTQPSTGENETAQIGLAPAATTGSGTNADASEPPPAGPIGAVGQTIPAKFSKRNDILDRTPIMATPLPLDREQRHQIYQAVMADKTAAAQGADALMPASQLPTELALNAMHPLPESVQGLPGLDAVKYVKGKNKVLLVAPATRIVVDQFTS